MNAPQITFGTHAPVQPPDPARMDVACFVGFISERTDATLPAGLREELAREYGAADLSVGQPDRLLNRPVRVNSLPEFEALYDADFRLEQRAVVEGGTLSDTLSQDAEPVLHVVIDGVIEDIVLDPLPVVATDLIDRVQAADLGLAVDLTSFGGLRIALDASQGAGTLAVLPNPAYGFPETRRARARAIPSPTGQAVRQFFANGGKSAVVVRLGEPVPYDVDRSERHAALIRLLTRPGDQAASLSDAIAALDLPVQPPFTEGVLRYGISHLYGLDDTTFLLLPDLPELVAAPPALAAEQPSVPEPEAVFAECLPADSDLADAAASAYRAPVTDAVGLNLWTHAIDRCLRLIRDNQRDKILLAALPRFAPDVAVPRIPASAFLQVAETWVRTATSARAPDGLMAPDALLAGHLAEATLVQGTFLSAAIRGIHGLQDIDPDATPSTLQTCRIMRTPGGYAWSADLTTAEVPEWRDAPVSRLMALLLRQARDVGSDLVFEPNAEALWAQVREAMAGLLEAARLQGALAGSGEGDSFTVRCDRTTMTQQDLDQGRLVCDVSFRPSVPVRRIHVRLPLGPARPSTDSGGPS